MNAIEWLHHHAPGFADLSGDERDAIMHFSLLWSRFEATALETNGSAKAIVDLTSHWADQGGLTKDSFAEALAYFRNRYVEQGAFTHHFDHLHFRHGDRQDLVELMLKGESDHPADIAAAVLIIVYRYRNNYLHGMKWAYELKGQLDNFTRANSVLMKALELHGQFGAVPMTARG
ncbi:hypothetical protein [Chelativorans intermedius]|uniref:Uncharacterized protein n=1 Tax=Chelativorans intermedius TaxID=515947 RepID=A0ABV6DCE8_9HYPH|nr:hypothetical protein [Chelativorans intermedius]MCT9000418.1 hypothetical protein [Chelativorans intermedius]